MSKNKRPRKVIRVSGKQVDFNKIVYRDRNNKVVKFSDRKKLKVELWLQIDGKKKIVKQSRYTLALRKRKNPVTPKSFKKQIQKRVDEKSKYTPVELKIIGSSISVHYLPDVEEVDDLEDLADELEDSDLETKEKINELEILIAKTEESLKRIKKKKEKLEEKENKKKRRKKK